MGRRRRGRGMGRKGEYEKEWSRRGRRKRRVRGQRRIWINRRIVGIRRGRRCRR